MPEQPSASFLPDNQKPNRDKQCACCRLLKWIGLAVLGPLVLAADLLLLLGGKVVGDVKGLPDLLGRLSLNHVGDGLATDVEQGLDIEVVRGLTGHSISIYTQRMRSGSTREQWSIPE